MKLIVGLGNPGREYIHTRHNCGFRVIDSFADEFDMPLDENKFNAEFGMYNIKGEKVILFKPLTYMNLSGTSVQQVVNFYKINTDDIIVVYDDMALEPGQIRLRLGGSSGGQKGMQNIIDCLSTNKIKRIRIGIGEPKFAGADHVLGKITGEEKDLISTAESKAVDALADSFHLTFENLMSKYNGG